LAKIIGKEAVMAIASGKEADVLTNAEVAMLTYARRVARDASRITAGEVAALRDIHGFSDAEIFDIATIAASRSFFTKVLDALGSEPDNAVMKMDEDLRRKLTVGRPIGCKDPERIDGERAA
jgi:hypothetical protein